MARRVTRAAGPDPKGSMTVNDDRGRGCAGDGGDAAGGRQPGGAAPTPPSGKPATLRRGRSAVPRITNEVIAESRYELVRAPDYAETRTWLVLVGGKAAGWIRPTWRGERSRPAWEPVGLSGLPVLVRGTGRVTLAGNARTRDAATVSLLRALQQEQHSAPGAHPARARETLGEGVEGVEALLIPS
jgi:hypothetical protein